MENNDVDTETIIHRYISHPSIDIISNVTQNMMYERNEFNFSEVTTSDVLKIMKALSTKKASGFDEIPIKFIKMAKSQLAKPMMIIVNKCLTQMTFPNNMKKANITPLYKKKDKLDKDNYRSINLLVGLSKIVEKIIANQIYRYVNPFLHKYLSGFRKGYGCQDILIRMTEEWRQALDEGLSVGVVAIDLSKAFDCMSHGLLLAKLHAYGFSLNACHLLKSYLVNRLQRVKIGDTYSEWLSNIKGVPQGSILGPLLFNIFINDFLFSNISSNIYNYADDNTLCFKSHEVNEIKSKLENDCEKAMEWFAANHMKANADKFQLMLVNKNNTEDNLDLKIYDKQIKSSTAINILGIEIDNKVNFNVCIDDICSKTSKQINAMKRIKNYLDNDCKKILYNSYISSNFNYCPLIWMYSGKTGMEKMEKTNKRALAFVTNDSETDYKELCRKEKQLTIYKRCIKAVAMQMFKIKNQDAPIYIQELFNVRLNNYDMRDNDKFTLPSFNSTSYGKKSFRYYGAKLWNSIPLEIKQSVSLNTFKNSLTNWLECIDNVNTIEFL